MVKIGFIVEGDTEKILVESPQFSDWLNRLGFELCRPVINAQGSGNLLPTHLPNYLKSLSQAGPSQVFVLTDLDNDPSVEAIQRRIQSVSGIDLVFVAVKAIESWFLADTEALRLWLQQATIYEEFPESPNGTPWDRLKEIAQTAKTRGPGSSKPAFAKMFIEKFHFSIENAASHQNCPSAQYLVKSLKSNFGK